MAAVGISLKIIYFFYWLVLIGRMLNLLIGDIYITEIPLQPCRHLTLKLLIQGHPQSSKLTHVADFKSAYISLIIGPRGLQLETNLQEIMGWESFDVARFDFGPLLQGQTRLVKLKVLITPILLVLEACNVKPTYTKSWAGNLLMWSYVTLRPSLKGKQWFTGFGKLSFQWILICIGSAMRRSSLINQ